VIDQGFAIGDDGVVDRVPIAAELFGHLVDAASAPADLFGDPAAGSVGHGKTRRPDAIILFGLEPLAQSGLGQRHRRLCHSTRAPPKQGRSTSVTIRWSFK